MAPVAMQTVWAFSHSEPADDLEDDLEDSHADGRAQSKPPMTAEQRTEMMTSARARNRNTCHVWADEGPMIERLNNAAEMPPPLWAEKRLAELGLDITEWQKNMR